MKKKHCYLCGHIVGQGNRHATGRCPPPRGRRGERNTFGLTKRRFTVDAANRGAAIAGTGRTKGTAKT